MTTRWRGTRVSLLVAGAVLLLSASAPAGAGASPAWKFEGKELTGSEAVVGEAVLSSLTIPGLTTTCKKMEYEMTISNSAGTGKAELKSLAFKTCFTAAPQCTVETIGAEKLPWPAHLSTVSGSNYIVFEGIKIAIRYAGEECVLGEVLVTVTGTAAGLYDNTSETFTLDSASFKANKTQLKALGSAIQWQAVFTTEAIGGFKGQALEVG